MGIIGKWKVATVVFAATAMAAAAPAMAQLQWKSADEKLTFKVGLLGQVQGESIDVSGTNDTAQNLFIRRARLLMNFTLGDRLTVFMDTDSPNLGKSNAAGVKDSGDMYIQDLVLTWKFNPNFMIDGGMLLPALSYNHNQSAASLLPVDYGAYTFVESTPIGARVGRDYGVQLRGYAGENRFEYRAGILQGNRGINAANGLRYYGRAMYSFFTPQVGLFYRGTSLGKTKTVAIGGSFDSQEDYTAYGFDFFADIPLKDGNGLTFQADVTQSDGDIFLSTLPKQNDTLMELGFYFAKAKVMPFVQYAQKNLKAEGGNDEARTSFGIGFFPSGHNHNVKISYTQIDPKVGDTLSQILVQWQVFQF